VKLRVYFINPRGEYATWRSTRQSSGYDIRTFEVRARPVGESANLRPGMSAIVER
jgi:HlyD family secretion protein